MSARIIVSQSPLSDSLNIILTKRREQEKRGNEERREFKGERRAD
jgi:hypothetical protein